MGKVDWELYGDTTEVDSSQPKITTGAYVCKILEVDDNNDKQLLKMKFDITQGEFKEYFKKHFEQYKEWASQGIKWQSYKPNSYAFLKNLVTALERSNSGYNFKATNGDFTKFANKLFVGVFGEEEIPFADEQGLPIVIVKLQSIRSLEALKAGDVKIPTEIKKLSGSQIDTFKANVATDKVVAEREANITQTTQADSVTDNSDFYKTSVEITEEKFPF